MLSLLLSLASSLVAAPRPRPAEPAPSAEVETAEPRLERGVLRVEQIDRAAFVEALALRVPHLRLEAMGEGTAPSPDESVAFVDLRPAGAPAEDGTRRFVLTIVVSDGRAFDREVDVGADETEPTRLLASTVANLLLAIEAGTVRADRDDVPLPTLEPAPPPCECPPPSCPPTDQPSETGPAEPTPAPASRLELAPVVAVSSVLGLGAPALADRFAAAGGAAGLHARLRRGAFFGTELRLSGRGHASGPRLLRLRVALGAGYRLRRGPLSLDASLWGTVEPWWVRGAPVDPPPRPLWGLAARVSPALWIPELGDRPLALRVGPVVELATSGSFGEEGAVAGSVVIRDGAGALGRLRVGGLELTTGLSASLWFGVR